MNYNNEYMDHNNKAFIIGGSVIYKECLNKHSDKINSIFVTHIFNIYECDTFFPNLKDYSMFHRDVNYSHLYEEKGVTIEINRYNNKRFQENSTTINL